MTFLSSKIRASKYSLVTVPSSLKTRYCSCWKSLVTLPGYPPVSLYVFTRYVYLVAASGKAHHATIEINNITQKFFHKISLFFDTFIMPLSKSQVNIA